MKTLKLTSITAFILLFISCKGEAQEQKAEKSSNQIEVIDFYSTHRCTTCRAIEENTRYTLENYFSEQLKDGTITFQTINVDKDENYDLARKFNATGTALFLNVIKNGKSKKIDLTEFAFMNGNDQATFSAELKATIDEQLNTM
jgi:thiol-disulfide isomerase/thioredoxin